MKKRGEEKNVAGVITAYKGNIVFYAENFKFTFMKTDFSNESIVVEVDDNGYIWGKTYEGKTIAIYSRKNIEVKNIRVLNTWNYIVSKCGMSKEYIQSFKGIRFMNGVIKTVFPCNALHQDIENTSSKILTYRIEQDSKEYKFELEKQSVLWRFHSVVNQRMSIYEGDSLSNSNSLLDIIFDEKQMFNTFYDFYGYVCNVCSFLTFRDNVTFEKVFLLCENRYANYEEYAECYINNMNVISTRDVMDIIPIRYLDDAVFTNIFLNIVKTDKEHKGLPLFILPNDEADAKTMDVGKIRNICSALEMELDLGGIRLESNPEMKKIINSVKKIIKEHREGDNKLSDKTYDYIGGNISHWNQPLVERVRKAWEQHEANLSPLINKYNIEITQEKIYKFIKARNDITHNGFTGLDEEVANTAFALIGLIYCCTLTRLKMRPDEIRYIMGKRLFQ